MVILDTCAIIEVLKPDPTFAPKTTKLMDAGAIILSLSFAEIACKVKLGKLDMGISTRDLFREFSSIDHIEIVDIGVTEWLDSVELAWNDNRDPADRVLTAFAIRNELPIVTTDTKIKTFYRKCIW